jgi:hypothetical protein
MHVVDAFGKHQLPDVGEDSVRRVQAGGVGSTVYRRGHTAGVEALDSCDQVNHRLPRVPVLVEVEAVRLRHQSAGADEQISEPGTRSDARVAMMAPVIRHEFLGLVPFTGEEDPIPRHEHVLEGDNAR